MKGRAWACALAAACLSNCLAPTEILLSLSTDAPCSDVIANGVAVGVGEPGVDPSANGAVSYACSDDGGLGTLVVTPSGSIDGHVGIRVTLGVDASVETCLQSPYTGCIVARRDLPYSPHEPLMLPIEMQLACLGNPCTDPSQTCIAGACVDAGVVCTAGTCDLPDASVGLDAGADAGADAAPPPQVCVPTALQAVNMQTPGGLQPRIARTPTGYAVVYGTTNSYIVGSMLSVELDGGVTIAPPGEVAILQPTTIVDELGPIASNGSNYVLTYLDNGFSDNIVSADTTGKVLLSNGLNNVAPASQGLIYAPSNNAYVTAAASGGASVQVVAWNATSLVQSAIPVNVGTAISQVAVGGSGSTYQIAAYDSSNQGCSSFQCNLADAGTNPPFVCSVPVQNATGCIGAATEASGNLVALAYDTSNTMNILLSGRTSPLTAGTIGSPPIGLVPTMGNSFRLVWQEGSQYVSAAVDATTTSPITPSVIVPGQSGITFDVAAFDPQSSLGYAVIISTVSFPYQILFQQFCP